MKYADIVIIKRRIPILKFCHETYVPFDTKFYLSDSMLH